ncbi:MAG: hypothetical protein WHV66_04945 [Anaerolineales bacterium]|jgi:hypothetical protein
MMKPAKENISKKNCPLCGAELEPVQTDGKVVYLCACGGVLRTVIEVIPEQIEGEENGCSN